MKTSKKINDLQAKYEYTLSQVQVGPWCTTMDSLCSNNLPMGQSFPRLMAAHKQLRKR